MNIMESKAGKALSLYAIFKGGDLIAKCTALYTDAGVCHVEVWQMGIGVIHKGKAGGYGYDKFTSALSGAVIDGHKIADHAEPLESSEPFGRIWYTECFECPLGYYKTNWNSEKQAFGSCHKQSGLAYLSELGYKVYQLL